MKRTLLVITLLAAGCSKPATEAPQAEAPAAPAAATTTAPNLATTSQWLQIAHTDANGGGVWVDPSLTKTDAATGLTDVVLKVDHGNATALDPQGATENLYRIEKVTFRFNCANKTYVVAKREALSRTGDVIDTTENPVDAAAFKPVAPKGVSSVAVGQACPGK